MAKRVVIVAALAAAAVAVVIAFTGSSGYTVTAVAQNAGQIVVGNDVRLGAGRVGEVTGVRLDDTGFAEIEMRIDGESAPLRRGTTASVRANSLVGSASRYVTLAPPAGGAAGTIPDGGRIPLVDTTSPVDFDVLLDTLDEPTREGLRGLIDGGADYYAGRSAEAREALRLLDPALSGTSDLMSELARDQVALRRLLRSGATATRAIASQRGRLASLVADSAATAAAVAGQSHALNVSLQRLPPTLRRATTTFRDLDPALDALDALVTRAKPATRDLAPFLDRTTPVLREARTTTPALADLVAGSGAHDDATDLLRDLPDLARRMRRASPLTIRALDRSQDFVDMLRAYAPDVLGAISTIGQASSYYDANGHYVRANPALGAMSTDPVANLLSLRPPSQRLSGFATGQGRRCPGAALPATPDGSAPVRVAGCDPSTSTTR